MKNFAFTISGAIRAEDKDKAERRMYNSIKGGNCTLKIIDLDKAEAKMKEIGFEVKPDKK